MLRHVTTALLVAAPVAALCGAAELRLRPAEEWSNLFGGVSMLGFEFPDEPLPVAVCWTAVAVFASLALLVIARKVRPVEVSR